MAWEKIILTEKKSIRRKKHGCQCPNAPAKEKREVEGSGRVFDAESMDGIQEFAFLTKNLPGYIDVADPGTLLEPLI